MAMLPGSQETVEKNTAGLEQYLFPLLAGQAPQGLNMNDPRVYEMLINLVTPVFASDVTLDRTGFEEAFINPVLYSPNATPQQRAAVLSYLQSKPGAAPSEELMTWMTPQYSGSGAKRTISQALTGAMDTWGTNETFRNAVANYIMRELGAYGVSPTVEEGVYPKSVMPVHAAQELLPLYGNLVAQYGGDYGAAGVPELQAEPTKYSSRYARDAATEINTILSGLLQGFDVHPLTMEVSPWGSNKERLSSLMQGMGDALRDYKTGEVMNMYNSWLERQNAAATVDALSSGSVGPGVVNSAALDPVTSGTKSPIVDQVYTYDWDSQGRAVPGTVRPSTSQPKSAAQSIAELLPKETGERQALIKWLLSQLEQ